VLTPSSGSEFDNALNYANMMLPEGKVVFVERQYRKNLLDSSNYIIGYLWMEKPSVNPGEMEIRKKLFDASLVLSGFAFAIPPWGEAYYNNYIEGYENEARKSGIGIWNKY
jgi:micrococcal nuclease